jgi:hypothetical protein
MKARDVLREDAISQKPRKMDPRREAISETRERAHALRERCHAAEAKGLRCGLDPAKFVNQFRVREPWRITVILWHPARPARLNFENETPNGWAGFEPISLNSERFEAPMKDSLAKEIAINLNDGFNASWYPGSHSPEACIHRIGRAYADRAAVRRLRKIDHCETDTLFACASSRRDWRERSFSMRRWAIMKARSLASVSGHTRLPFLRRATTSELPEASFPK